uniref:NUDIX domain-containing protein n=1 Tax=Amycolatopsis sp. CA-096443 TaxID=3239919 RepID=UPI003F493882
MPRTENTEPVVLAAVVVAFAFVGVRRHLLLRALGTSPGTRRRALPGDRVQPGENSRAAAARVLSAAIGLPVPERTLRYLGAWNHSGRDPRGTSSTDACLTALAEMPTPAPGAEWAALAEATDLVPGHGDICAAACRH